MVETYDIDSCRVFGCPGAGWHRNNHRRRALSQSFIQSAHDRIRANGGILVRVPGGRNQRDSDSAGCSKHLGYRKIILLACGSMALNLLPSICRPAGRTILDKG